MNVLDLIFFFSSLLIEVCSAQMQQLQKFKRQVKCHDSPRSRRTPAQMLAAGNINHVAQLQLLSMERTQGARRT